MEYKIANWNTAYDWGDHAGLYPLLTGTYANPAWISSLAYSKLTGTPSIPTNTNQLINGAGFITGITSGNVTTALGYTPVNPNGTSGQYIKGDGTKTTFPSIPAAQVNSDWNSGSGVSQILNKPTVPTNTNQLTNGAGFITGINSSDVISALGYTPANNSITFNNAPNRSLSTTGSNNTFTISTTKNARVSYTVNFSFALTLVTSNGVVSLDYSTNGGSSWTTVCSVSNAYTVAVTLTGNTDSVLYGDIPANALVRIYRSANTNVTVGLSTSKQQEITY